MKSVRKLILLFENLLLVGESVSQSDVLQSELVHLLIFGGIMLLPVFDHFVLQFLTGSAEDGILSDTSLEFLELVLNFLALCLLLIQLCLQLRGHSIVAVLGFFQIESDLVDIGESVKVLVFIQKRVI